MVIIYVYYNPNSDKFYYKKYITYPRIDERVRNSYGHLIVQKLLLTEDYIMDLNLFLDLENKKKFLLQEKKKKKRIKKYNRKLFIKKIINNLIDLLYIIKSKF